MIRVFARKTKWAPTDKDAFFGPPPYSLKITDKPVYVSVTFTWDIGHGKWLAGMWEGAGFEVKLGGPAFDDPGGEFVPGRFVQHGVTITSRGCPKKCPWCLVPQREGRIRETNIAPGHIVQDNNLLACTVKHIETVFEMLKWQSKGIEFKGGLDIDYMKPWHVELLKKIKVAELWVACDRPEDIKRLDKASDLLSDFPIEKKRCYVLMGFRGESIRNAEARCKAVYAKGFLPFAQLYQDDLTHSKPKFTWPADWRALQRKWSRPAAYRAKKSNIENINLFN